MAPSRTRRSRGHALAAVALLLTAAAGLACVAAVPADQPLPQLKVDSLALEFQGFSSDITRHGPVHLLWQNPGPSSPYDDDATARALCAAAMDEARGSDSPPVGSAAEARVDAGGAAARDRRGDRGGDGTAAISGSSAPGLILNEGAPASRLADSIVCADVLAAGARLLRGRGLLAGLGTTPTGHPVDAEVTRVLAAFARERTLLEAELASAGVLEGWVEGGTFGHEYKLRALVAAAVMQPAQVACEVGFNMGHSALLWLLAHPTGDGVVHAFDLGEHEYAFVGARYLMRRFPGRLRMHFGDSAETVPTHARGMWGPVAAAAAARRHGVPEPAGTQEALASTEWCDFVFVDGGHSYAEAKADLDNVALLVGPERSGGSSLPNVMAGDGGANGHRGPPRGALVFVDDVHPGVNNVWSAWEHSVRAGDVVGIADVATSDTASSFADTGGITVGVFSQRRLEQVELQLAPDLHAPPLPQLSEVPDYDCHEWYGGQLLATVQPPAVEHARPSRPPTTVASRDDFVAAYEAELARIKEDEQAGKLCFPPRGVEAAAAATATGQPSAVATVLRDGAVGLHVDAAVLRDMAALLSPCAAAEAAARRHDLSPGSRLTASECDAVELGVDVWKSCPGADSALPALLQRLVAGTAAPARARHPRGHAAPRGDDRGSVVASSAPSNTTPTLLQLIEGVLDGPIAGAVPTTLMNTSLAEERCYWRWAPGTSHDPTVNAHVDCGCSTVKLLVYLPVPAVDSHAHDVQSVTRDTGAFTYLLGSHTSNTNTSVAAAQIAIRNAGVEWADAQSRSDFMRIVPRELRYKSAVGLDWPDGSEWRERLRGAETVFESTAVTNSGAPLNAVLFDTHGVHHGGAVLVPNRERLAVQLKFDRAMPVSQ